MGFHQKKIKASDLAVIKRAVPRLFPVGSAVRLNSGSPVGFVMERDEATERVKVRFPSARAELFGPEVCFEPA